MTEATGKLCGSPCCDVVLHALADDFAFATVVGQIAELSQIVLAAQRQTAHLGVLGGQHTGADSFVSLVDVDVASQALQDDVSQNRHSGFAHHAVGVVAHQVPHGQFAPFAIDGKHRLGVVAHTVGHDDGSQRMSGTIGVPKAPCGERSVVGTTMDLEVGTHVVAGHVAPYLRVDHVVVHGRIEDGSFTLGAERSLDARELCLPSLESCTCNAVEVEAAGLFGNHIEQGIGLARGRESHLDHHVVARVNLEGCLTVLGIRAFTQPVVDRPVELHAEIDNLVVSPTVAATVAHQRVVIDGHDACVASLVANGVLQVDDDAGIVAALGESEAIECRTFRSRHLAHDAEAVQQDTIVAWLYVLSLVAVLAGNAFTRKLYVAVGRHQTDVAQVAATGAAQVHLSKANDFLATLMVTGAPVPARLNLVRTSIDHTEGHAGTDEDMTVVARTDTGIHILHQVLGLCRSSKQKAKKKKFTFH